MTTTHTPIPPSVLDLPPWFSDILVTLDGLPKNGLAARNAEIALTQDAAFRSAIRYDALRARSVGSPITSRTTSTKSSPLFVASPAARSPLHGSGGLIDGTSRKGAPSANTGKPRSM